jgi:hypothetical protein
MKTTEQMIEAAKQEAMSKYGGWTPALEDAIKAGLVDGDEIGLGGKLIAHIYGDQVAMVNDGKETARMPIASLSDQQRERMLVLKGQQQGRVSYKMGSIRI